VPARSALGAQHASTASRAALLPRHSVRHVLLAYMSNEHPCRSGLSVWGFRVFVRRRRWWPHCDDCCLSDGQKRVCSPRGHGDKSV